MAAKSKNKYDVANWVKSVIDSCKNHMQWTRCIPLMKGFLDVHKDQELYRELRMRWTLHNTVLGEQARQRIKEANEESFRNE